VALLLPAMLIFGASMSLFDIAINTEGSELESLGGRAIMSNLHGMFSVGGMTARHSSPGCSTSAWHRGCSSSAFAAASRSWPALRHVECSRRVSPARIRARRRTSPGPKGLLLIIGLLIFAGMTAEGVMYDWSVLYLKQEVGMPQAQAALGYAVFSAAMALSRFGGDSLRSRYSERALLRFGASIASIAMAVVSARGEFVGRVHRLCAGRRRAGSRSRRFSSMPRHACREVSRAAASRRSRRSATAAS
jgi:hypothetical protein